MRQALRDGPFILFGGGGGGPFSELKLFFCFEFFQEFVFHLLLVSEWVSFALFLFSTFAVLEFFGGNCHCLFVINCFLSFFHFCFSVIYLFIYLFVELEWRASRISSRRLRGRSRSRRRGTSTSRQWSRGGGGGGGKGSRDWLGQSWGKCWGVQLTKWRWFWRKQHS